MTAEPHAPFPDPTRYRPLSDAAIERTVAARVAALDAALAAGDIDEAGYDIGQRRIATWAEQEAALHPRRRYAGGLSWAWRGADEPAGDAVAAQPVAA